MLHKTNTFFYLMLIGLCLITHNTQAQKKYKELSTLRQLPLYTSLEEALKHPLKVQRLKLVGKQYTAFPKEIFQLKNLRWLDLSWNDKNHNGSRDYGETKNYIRQIPKEIGSLEHLEMLNFESNLLTEVPPEIGDLKKLKYLSLSWNNILSLPQEIGNLRQLITLFSAGNRLHKLPKTIAQLKKLKYVFLSNNLFKDFPEELLVCKQLKKLYLARTPLTQLPTNIHQLSRLEALHLGNCLLEALPESLSSLSQLKKLLVYRNKLKSLPKTIGKLKQLKILRVHANQLKYLPKSLGQMQHLVELRANHNRLTRLPNSIGQLCHIKELHLGNNQLHTLPAEVTQLKSLTIFDISQNDSLKVPPFFFPWLKKNHNGLSSRLTKKIHQADLRVLRRQQIINKQWHHLQNKKAKETQWLVAIGVVVVMMLCVVLMIVHSTHKQQRDKKRITEQAQQLKLQNTEIQQRAVALKKSIKQLEKLQVFRQKMEAMITLDLQHPLATINQLVMTPPSKEDARMIYQAGQRMNHTIANMLDVQKFKKVGIKPSLKLHLFNQLIHKALEKVNQISLPNTITLRHSILPIKVNVDEALMIRVLVNLLTMSAKLAQPNQPITIATTLENGNVKVVISVEKKKSGEPTQTLDHYETNDPSQAIANSMLLAFCKMVVKAHQGTIQMSTSSTTQTVYYGFELPQATSFCHPENDEVGIAHRLKFNFNESEKKQLSICLPLLQKQLVYQVSSIEQLLAQVEAQKESELDRWKETLLNAVENCDNKAYTTLINI